MAHPPETTLTPSVAVPSASLSDNRLERSIVFLFFALLAIGTARIVSTYRVFSQTFDEPAHIACGMQWLDRGVYLYEPQHPPLARVSAAIGPYLDGSRSVGRDTFLTEGNEILYGRGTYFRTLSLARLGILPFFWVASVLVWVWSTRISGKWEGLAASLLFTSLPPVLAHAGLATTDMALTACLLGAIYAFTLWLETPTLRQTLFLGLASGAAVLSKFTTFLFLPACAVVLLTAYWFAEKLSGRTILQHARSQIKLLTLAGAVAFLVMWAGYRFSLNPLPRKQTHLMVAKIFGTEGRLHDLANQIVETPIPGTELIRGLRSVYYHARDGHHAYLLGEQRRRGWWYFFPVAVAVKTPIAFLILVGAGVASLLRRSPKRLPWRPWAPFLCAASILSVCLPSTINLGVRHILPMYGLLAVVASVGAASLLQMARRRSAYGFMLLALVLWHSISSALAHPDYLAYFNEAAPKPPESVLVESDLDWGQDLQRLSEKLAELRIPEVTIGYFGSADLARHGLPAVRPLLPDKPATGWIAVSLSAFKIEELRYGEEANNALSAYSWLKRHQPVARIGKSILLYYVPPGAAMKQGPSPALFHSRSELS
jgi:hypothetical protein